MDRDLLAQHFVTRDASIWNDCERKNGRSPSYRAIGEKYRLSAERIRQIFMRGSRRRWRLGLPQSVWAERIIR